ncbi:hypothetical protein LO763_17185 [Glycomyces sp. A-F 0318]|uniref:hypothetical protein n=1 Tax=Glycomyces amatae TaxID=2881355 RepID=UPI001E3FDEB7|nr:hypothetical protein [Glycomyces amatae]MCD0445350.1 hypothetical protein [Glycomyces amatae]
MAPSPTADASTTDATEPSPAEEPTGEVHVLDLDTFEGDDSQELSLQRPEELTLSEFSSGRDLEWESWGGASAVATGRITGMFCESGCEGEEYEVTLVLCEVADDHYRRFGVFGDFPEFDDAEWAFGGPLYIGGTSPEDGDWSDGCAEPEPGEADDRA